MIFHSMVCNMMSTNCYIFGDEVTKEVVFIDPGGEPTAIAQRIETEGLKPIAIILTHGHPDHTGSAKHLSELYKIPIKYHKKDIGLAGIRKSDGAEYIKEPDVIKISSEELYVLDSPGHSPGGILLISFKNKIIFTGDTLFQGSIGRTDLGGDENALFNSIKTQIMYNPKVDDSFQIFPGHMYESTVGEERQNNAFRNRFL